MKLRVSVIAAMLVGVAPVVGGYVSVGAPEVTASCVYATSKATHQVPRICADQAGTTLQASLPANRIAN
jgi:hypothetical protein